MHCDDKRTIFALNQKLTEAKLEKENLLRIIKIEKDSSIKNGLETKLMELEEFILQIQNQLSHNSS